MNLTNLLKVAITAIMSNKSRTLLSTLGIIIGVAAVITMMAIGQGSKESIRTELSKMGTNLLTIRPGGEMRGGVRLDPSAMQTLKMTDYEAIQNEAKLITHISPEVNAAGQVIYGAKNTNTTVYGESPEYLSIKLWEIKDGECFTDEDIKKSAKVCVVGTTIVEELFGDKNFDAVGKTIRFKSIPFRIVGILKSKGYNSWGMDQDNVMIAPYTTVMKRIAAQTFFNSINVSALKEELSDEAIEELSTILRRNHKIKEGDDDDFTIRSQQEMMETMSSTMTTLQTVLVVAAAFSLLVAGIGIMNIMLVSVTERTKEIGVRRALGAKPWNIISQIMSESLLITAMAGLMGLTVGVFLLDVVDQLIGDPVGETMLLHPAVSIQVALAATSILLLAGLLAGLIPAWRAMQIKAIDAIREE